MIENNLKEISNKLGIRFPIAEFSRQLNMSKGVISEYYNNKKRVSENFIAKLENRYNIVFKTFLDNTIQNKKLPVLKKGNIEITIKDILIFLIDNEKELIENDNQFKRYVEDLKRQGVIDFFEKNKEQLIKK